MKNNQVSGLRKAVITGVMGLAGLVSSAGLSGCGPNFRGVMDGYAESINGVHRETIQINPYDYGDKINASSEKLARMSTEQKQRYLKIFKKNPERYEKYFKYYYSENKANKITDDNKIHMVIMGDLSEKRYIWYDWDFRLRM